MVGPTGLWVHLMRDTRSSLSNRSRGCRVCGPRVLFTTLVLSIATAAPDPGEVWPQFRGPNGDGHHPHKLALEWGENSNIRWKTAVHGKGWASPVIWGDQIWLATATEDGRELSIVAIDRDAGEVQLDRKLFDVAEPQFCHRFNSYASPTPVIEDHRIYVTFGSPGTACLDTRTGAVIWERRDFECNHYRGAGSSPIVHGHLLVMHFDGSDRQYLVALDKHTGKTVWQTQRSVDYQDLDPHGQPKMEGDLRKAFATPHVARFDGCEVLLSSGAMAHYAYDPLSGRELWRLEDRTAHSASTRPAVGHGLVFVPAGWPNGQLLAIRPGRQGEVLDTNTENPGASQLAVAWRVRRSVPRKPSVLVVDDLLFMIDDGGIASCLEAKTGVEVWRERVSGNYSASPIYAAGRLYFCSEEGKTTVVAAAREFGVLAENHLEEGFMASPAAAGSALFLRSRTHLYRIETGAPTRK
jgi:outer membrane protein assembly factor BamB